MITREQIKLGELIYRRLDSLHINLDKLNEFIIEKDTELKRKDNDLHIRPYGLHIGEHADMSGFSLDLTGYGDNLGVLKAIQSQINTEIKQLELKVETL